MRIGILFLVSGPSGSGKTTLCERLQSENQAHYAISCTTRQPREGEKHGEDYFFLREQEFITKKNNSEFIEHAEVHGNYYGTLSSEVLDIISKGQDVVMDIDVQGANSIRNCGNPMIIDALVDVFVMPESQQELRTRLVDRSTDSEEIIQKRMLNAQKEIEQSSQYTYLLLSKDREHDYLNFKSILIAERLKQSRNVNT